MFHPFIVIFIQIVFSPANFAQFNPLSNSENEEIQQICGIKAEKVLKPERKVLRGIKIQQEDTPWVVEVKFKKAISHQYCTGTLISPRHVLTARHCFLTDDSDGITYWISANEKNNYSTCIDEDLIIPERFTKIVEVYFNKNCDNLRNCRRGTEKRVFDKRKASKIILPGSCRHQEKLFLQNNDFAIIELEENILFSKYIIPACLAGQYESAQVANISLKMAGYGIDPSDTSEVGSLKHFVSRIVKCRPKTEKWWCTLSETGKQLACVGDSGAGLISEMNERVFVFAVLSRGISCFDERKKSVDWNIPVIQYAEKICQYTGLCLRKYQRKFVNGENSKYIRYYDPNPLASFGSIGFKFTIVCLILSYRLINYLI